MTRSQILGRVGAGARIAGVLTVAVLGLAACGDDEQNGTAAVDAVTTATAISPAPTPAEGAAPWPAPANPLRLTVAAGLQPERKEKLTHHVHAHLDVFVNGKPVVVPAGIGINIEDPGVKTSATSGRLKAYGGIELCAKPCISPLHTHDSDRHPPHRIGVGRTRTRSGSSSPSGACGSSRTCVGGYCRPSSIAIYVERQAASRRPARDRADRPEEIAIVIGTPPTTIPKTGDFTAPDSRRNAGLRAVDEDAPGNDRTCLQIAAVSAARVTPG